MQETSALYRQILATEPHWFEVSVVIGESGVLITEYGDKILFGDTAIIVSRDSPDSGYREERLMNVQTRIQMFNDGIEIGRAISQEIEVTIIKPSADLPNMALIAPYVRVCSENATSEWVKQGVFYIDTRSYSDNDSEGGLVTLTLHGYDAMLMTEQYYTDTGNLDWSSGTVVDTDMVSDIARIIGVSVDERTWDVMTSGYRVPLPTSYTLREILGYIASMYIGCFIMTDEGLLRLVSILELPPETSLLIDQVGDYIVFGEDRILV